MGQLFPIIRSVEAAIFHPFKDLRTGICHAIKAWELLFSLVGLCSPVYIGHACFTLVSLQTIQPHGRLNKHMVCIRLMSIDNQCKVERFK